MFNSVEDTTIDLEGGVECPPTKTSKIDCFGIERSQADIDARNECWLECLGVLLAVIGWILVIVLLIGLLMFPLIAALTTNKTTQIVLASISGVYALALLCALLYGIYVCGRKYVFFV